MAYQQKGETHLSDIALNDSAPISWNISKVEVIRAAHAQL